LTAKRGRLITLTDEGAALAHDLTLGFEHLNRGLRRVLEPKDRKVIALTVLPWFASRWLIPRLADFQQRCPQADIRIATTPELMNLQREGFDGGIRYGRGRWSGHQAELLLPGRVSPLVHRSLIERLGFPVHPAELARYPLLASTSAPDHWASWWNSAGMAGALPTASQTYDSREFVMHAVLEGSGVGHSSNAMCWLRRLNEGNW
jgi:LysR family glycine cleavage system transcriptional activator